jgi:hypothetical protein
MNSRLRSQNVFECRANINVSEIASKHNPILLTPRTPVDFIRIELWAAEGKTTAEIFQMITRYNWRSEVLVAANNCTTLCACCLRRISLTECIECGMTIFAEEDHNDE